MKSGIYQILDKINKKSYIGSSSNLNKRYKQHFNSLIKNKHYNDYLQYSFNKHGIENFEYKILCKCPELELINLEQYYIDTLKPEYNAVKVAGKTTGYKFTEKQRKYQSESRGIPIIRINLLSGEIIDEWKSAKFASLSLKLGKPTAINACCRGKIPSAYGFYWIYKKDKDNFKLPNKSKCQPINKLLINEAKELYKIGLSISKIAKQLNLSYHVIYYHVKS